MPRKQLSASVTSQMHNFINLVTTIVFAADYDLLAKRKTVLAEDNAREKSQLLFRGYSFMGNIHVSPKYAQVDAPTSIALFPQLDYAFWERGTAINKEEEAIRAQATYFKQWLFLHLENQCQGISDWVSSMPRGLVRLMPAPYNDIQLTKDPGYFQPVDAYASERWNQWMDLIHAKLAMRLLT